MPPLPSTPDLPASQVPPALAAAVRALGTSGGGAGAAKLLALLYDPEVEHATVVGALNAEPSLAARVLKVANSPYYHRSGSIGTIDRAVQLLGLTAIRGIAAAGCLDRLAPPRAGQAFDPGRFRRHSLAVGSAARRLSGATAAGVDGEAFMAGLLHDIGVLVLAKAQAAAMARFEPGAGDDDEAAALEEERHFGITHEATAALLLRIWGLPAWLGAALAAHHRPPPALAWAAGEQGLPALLRLADHVAERAGFGLWPRCAAQPAACPPGLGDDDLDAIAAALSDDVAHLSAT